MSQDRLTEGGRNLVWTAVREAINAHRRRGALQRELVVKFERLGFTSWQPGDPDDAISEQEIQALINDIAADACKRLEAALDDLEPRESVGRGAGRLRALERAQARWKGRESPDLDEIPTFRATTLGIPNLPPAPVDAEPEPGKLSFRAHGKPVTAPTYPIADVKPWKKLGPLPDDQLLNPAALEPMPCCCSVLRTRICGWCEARLDGPPEPRWQVWKKRYMDGWVTHDRYRHLTRNEADRQANGFKLQMTVLDVAVLPAGEKPWQQGLEVKVLHTATGPRTLTDEEAAELAPGFRRKADD